MCLVVAFIQETMSSRYDACNFLLRLRPGWLVSDVDSVSNYGGISVAWKPLLDHLISFNTCVGLLLKGNLQGFGSLVHLLNIYGP